MTNRTILINLSTQERNDMIAKATQFLQDVKTEMSKVSWPPREQLKGQTGIVILVSLLFSIFIFGVDHLLSWLVQLIY